MLGGSLGPSRSTILRASAASGFSAKTALRHSKARNTISGCVIGGVEMAIASTPGFSISSRQFPQVCDFELRRSLLRGSRMVGGNSHNLAVSVGTEGGCDHTLSVAAADDSHSDLHDRRIFCGLR